MPRYVRPIPVIKVESLSTGMPIDMDGPMVDDFTNEPIARVWPGAAPKAMQSAQAILDEANKAKHRQNMALLQAGGIVPKPTQVPACASSTTTPKVRPQAITLVRSAKPWRRV